MTHNFTSMELPEDLPMMDKEFAGQIMKITDAIDVFIGEYENEATAKTYKYCLNQFVGLLTTYQVYHCEQLTNDFVVKFMEQLISNGSSKRTEDLKKAILITFYKWVRSEELSNLDIFELEYDLKMLSSNKDYATPKFNKRTIEMFLYTLPTLLNQELTQPQRFLYLRDCALFFLLAHSGLRVAEASRITMGDLDFDNNQIKNIKLKGGDIVNIPFTNIASEHLLRFSKEYPKGDMDYLFDGRRSGRIKPRGIQRRLDWYSDKIDLPIKITPHMFRHYFLTVISSHAGLDCAQHYANHKSVQSTRIYTHGTNYIPDLDSIFAKEYPQ